MSESEKIRWSHGSSACTRSTVSVAVLAALAVMTTPGWAAEKDDKENTIDRMAEVEVVEVVEHPGRTILSAEELSLTPNAQGTVRDALRTQSFIAFDGNSRTSDTAGEIFSSQISIRGSHPYENQYTINGLSNTNSMKVGNWNNTQCIRNQNGGDSQSMMLSDELVSDVDIFSENISAEYGDFTGGVVNAQIRDADMNNYHGKVWYRFSNDSMARVHGKKGQHEFDRFNTGVRLEGPIVKDKLAGLISFERTKSTIPTLYDRDKKTRRLLSEDTDRTNDNLLIKVHTNPKEDHYASFTFLHAPFERESVYEHYKNGDFTLEGGGWSGMINLRNKFKYGTWRNDLSYSYNEINRRTPTSVAYAWPKFLTADDGSDVISETIDFSFYAPAGLDGTIGDQEAHRYTFELKSAFDVDPIETNGFTNNIKVGGQIKHERSKAHLDAYTLMRASPWEAEYTPDVKGEMADGIIEGEQFLPFKDEYYAQDRTYSLTSGAVFIENRIEAERVTLRPGLRASWDSFTDNVNFAPRLFANVDILHDGRFNVNAGFNRYFGTILQEKALEIPVKNGHTYRREMNEDGTVGDWEGPLPTGPAVQYDRLGDLKTPYSDEFTLGASAEILDGTLFKIVGVKREYRDQLRSRIFRPEGFMGMYPPKEHFNGGKTDYKGITLSVNKHFDWGRFGSHMFDFGVTKSKLTGNMAAFNYDFVYGVPDTVFIDGKEVPVDDLPASNFNPEWTVTFSHAASFMHDRLRTMALLRYESSADHLIYDPTVGDNNKFWTSGVEHKFNVDLSAQIDLLKVYGSTVTLHLEALNVTNNQYSTLTTAESKFDVKEGMGRQFFIGLSAEF